MYGRWTEYAVLWTNSLGFIFETYKTFLITEFNHVSIITEFDRKGDFQNHLGV